MIDQIEHGWHRTFAALKYRNYRLWFWGQMLSISGSWMQITAQGFFVYELTQSPAYLGYVSFVAGIPTWLFMLYAGVISDRVSRRTLLIITQSCMMMLAFALAVLTFSGLVKPWHIMVMAFLSGMANTFEAPSRLAFVLEMVDREDLTNAIALNATMFNTAMALGPALSGVVYAMFGPAWCFTINGISFIAVIIALLLMKLKANSVRAERNSTVDDLKEGFHYVISHTLIRTMIIMGGIASLFGISFATLLPAWAVTVLGGDARTNGLLQSARGIGALIGALVIASLGRFKFKGKLLTAGTITFPAMLIIFTLIRWTPLSLLILILVGTSSIFVMNMANALIQTLAEDKLRGRVMSFYSLIFFGTMPIGSLWVGAAAEYTSEASAIAINAAISLCAAVAIWFFVPELRALE